MTQVRFKIHLKSKKCELHILSNLSNFTKIYDSIRIKVYFVNKYTKKKILSIKEIYIYTFFKELSFILIVIYILKHTIDL